MLAQTVNHKVKSAATQIFAGLLFPLVNFVMLVNQQIVMKQQDTIRQETISSSDQAQTMEDILSIFLLTFAVGDSENYIYQEASPGHCDEMQMSIDLSLSLH